MNVTVRASGPFFRLGAGPVLDSLHDAIVDTTMKGEGLAVAMAQPRERGGSFHSGAYAAAHGYKQTGHYARSIHGVVAGSIMGLGEGANRYQGVVVDSNVVYGPWLEGVSSRNQATRFKGYAIFRRTRDKLQGLAQQILRYHVDKAIARLK